MDLISRDKAQDAVFSKEDIMGYMDGVEDGDINRTIRSAIRLIERVPSAFEGMTNGEVIQAVFGVMVLTIKDGKVWVERIFFPFDEVWWNAPYKEESDDAAGKDGK